MARRLFCRLTVLLIASAATNVFADRKVRAVSEAWRRGGGSAMVQTPDP